jgi:hypothetical protein
MCSPRGENSASQSLASYLAKLFPEDNFVINQFQIYKTMKDENLVTEMINQIDKSDILILSSPLYIDSPPHMTIRLMNLISKATEESRISEKKRILLAISCAGYLEFYHNNIALRIYEQFAKKNGFTWAGGFPIGAAGTYVAYPIPKLLEMIETLPKDDWIIEYYGKPAVVLDEVMKSSVEYLSKGEVVPEEELKKLHHVAMPLETYAEGGNKNWIGWAEQLGTVDKLRDKPYELKK